MFSASMLQHLLARLLRFDRQHVARRNEPDVQLIPHVVQMRADALQRLSHDIHRRASGDHRPVSARDLELQVGARGLAILPGRVGLGRRQRA